MKARANGDWGKKNISLVPGVFLYNFFMPSFVNKKKIALNNVFRVAFDTPRYPNHLHWAIKYKDHNMNERWVMVSSSPDIHIENAQFENHLLDNLGCTINKSQKIQSLLSIFNRVPNSGGAPTLMLSSFGTIPTRIIQSMPFYVYSWELSIISNAINMIESIINGSTSFYSVLEKYRAERYIDNKYTSATKQIKIHGKQIIAEHHKIYLIVVHGYTYVTDDDFLRQILQRHPSLR